MSHKDRREQRERKEQMRQPKLARGVCSLCHKRNPTSKTCPASPVGHLILEG